MSDFSDSTPEIRWYIAHTYSGYENKVKANLEKIIENRGLQNVIVDVKIPVRIISEDPEDVSAVSEDIEFEGYETSEENAEADNTEKAVPPAKKITEEKIFPCYVFVKMIMNDETWHIVRNIRGVTGFVGPGQSRVPLSEEEVLAIGELEEKTVINLNYKVGDSVKIVSGFLKDFVGVVEDISEDKKKIKVLASMFGRDTPVELDSKEVAPLEN